MPRESNSQCKNGGMEPHCLDKCGVSHGDGSSCVYQTSIGTVQCYGDLTPDACGICGGKSLDVCRDVIENTTIIIDENTNLKQKTFIRLHLMELVRII